MTRVVFDLETNNLLPKVNRIHCLAITDVDTEESFIFNDEYGGQSRYSIDDGLAMLDRADVILGHNVINYDIPVLQKLRGWTPKAEVMDTLVMSRLIHADIRDEDFSKRQKGDERLPPKLIGSHSLKAWGHRIGHLKGAFKEQHGFDTWSPEMEQYCIKDTLITRKIFLNFEAKDYSAISLDLEHRFATIMTMQEMHGFSFDVNAANKLYGELAGEKLVIDDQLQEIFPPKEIQMKSTFWKAGNELFETKTAAVASGYKAKDVVKGPNKIKRVPFNSLSRDHIAERLCAMGWEPVDFTEGGKPKVDETVLSGLAYPEAQMLSKVLLLQKRMGQLGDGKAGWLKLERQGRMHGHVVGNGAVTGRCTHRSPNMAQVPRDAAYRALFTATDGMVLVGCDAAGLELRCLAHYMNDDVYISKLLESDIHEVNQEAAGLPTRDNAKTFIYGFLYGAGDEKIGQIIGKGAAEGKSIKKKFLKSLPSLRVLKEKISKALKTRNYLWGLDGRRLHVRSEHSALNTLLQSAGAVLMKKATVILFDKLLEMGLNPSEDFSFVAHVHDEFQIECWPEFAEKIAAEAEQSIVEAGEAFNFRCPLAGTAKEGSNWAETH
jgi:DNA polymerase I-like protein with 3'-5' exonuclease and polymerase domains